MKSTQKKDIKFGSKNLLAEDEFDPKYGKERITLFLDQQVVDAFREQAKKTGKKYQALIRDTLKEVVFATPTHNLEDRVTKLEQVLLKKKA